MPIDHHPHHKAMGIFFIITLMAFLCGSIKPLQAQSSGSIFWSTLSGEKIQSGTKEGSLVKDLVTRGATRDFRRIRLDQNSGKIYWHSTHPDKIQRANVDGSDIQDLAIASSGILGLDLDPIRGKMYWSVSRSIYRANLDGTNQEQIVNDGTVIMRGIAIDEASSKMYWIEDNRDWSRLLCSQSKPGWNK